MKTTVMLLALAAVLATANPAVADSIKWYSYDQGQALARDKGLKMMVHFYADWCRYCVKMNKETFSDPAVIAYLNRHFVPVKVNYDKEKKLVARYRVRPLPATFFMSEEGKNIGQLPGYVPPKNMISLLKYIGSNSYRKMSFKQFVSQPETSK